MIVRSHNELPEMDEARTVAAVVSLPGTIARSVGATLADVPVLFGQPDLYEGHARMTGRWSFPAPALGPLQRMVNAILFDAQTVGLEDIEDVQREAVSALSLARSVLVQAFFAEGDDAFVAEALACAGAKLETYGPGDDERADRGDRYASFLPSDRMVELVDPGTVESVVAVMVGIQRADVVSCGVPKSTAAGYLNGREDWLNQAACQLLCERVAETMARIRSAVPLFDEPATDEQGAMIHALTPAETATMWQLFPIARPEIERWSPWMFKFGEPECE